MTPTPARASAAAHSLLRRTRCFAAANRIRPTERAFSSGGNRAAGYPGQRWDDELNVAIVGGGMVGSAVACALCELVPISTCMFKFLRVDQTSVGCHHPALKSRGCLKKDSIPDSRVSTVTPATISFFRDIGAWEHIQQQRHAFFGKMQVWDYTGLGYTMYNARDVCKEHLGCVVENKVLCNSLLLRLQEQKEDIEKMIYPTRLVSLAFPSKSRQGAAGLKSPSTEADSTGHISEALRRSNLVKLELSDGQTLYSKLVIGADGSKSNVR